MNKLYYFLFHLFRILLSLIPVSLRPKFFRWLSKRAYQWDKKHRHIAHVNLDLAFEHTKTSQQKKIIVLNCYYNMIHYLFDFIKNQATTKTQILQKVSFHNEHIFQQAKAQQQPIILTTAHYGNWELLSLGIAAQFGPLSIVGRDLDSALMNRILQTNREQFDITLISKNGAMKQMVNTMKSNQVLGLLVDQNTSDNEGILIDFFGKKARHTPSASILARRFNAIIIPVFIQSNHFGHHTITFYNPIKTSKTSDSNQDILDSVQQQAAITQTVIEQNPEEWFWFHQRWKNQYETWYNKEQQ